MMAYGAWQGARTAVDHAGLARLVALVSIEAGLESALLAVLAVRAARPYRPELPWMAAAVCWSGAVFVYVAVGLLSQASHERWPTCLDATLARAALGTYFLYLAHGDLDGNVALTARWERRVRVAGVVLLLAGIAGGCSAASTWRALG